MKVRLDASRLLVYRGASRLEQAPDAALDASIAKLFVSEALVKSALDTIQILGGYGFMTDSEVERVLRNKKGATLEEMKQALGTSGTMTVFRKLKALGCPTS